MEEKIRIVRKFNQENRYRDGGVLNNAIDDTLNELERLQKENNDLRAIRETVRYLEEEGVKDDLYYVVGRGSYLAKVLENAQDFKKTVHTCSHCGENTPLYCEKCYQELISKNAELQLENNQLKRKIFDLYNSSGEYEKAKCIMTKELRDYIPKQAIRDKIQELKAKYNLGDDYWQYDYDVDMNTIDILEELSRE